MGGLLIKLIDSSHRRRMKAQCVTPGDKLILSSHFMGIKLTSGLSLSITKALKS